MDIPRQMGCDSAAFLPVLRDGKIVSILILGQSKEQKDSSGKRFQTNPSYNSESLQPYFYLIDTFSSTIEKIKSQQDIRKRLSEVQTLWNISQAISVENDLQALYKVIHNQAEKVMGKLSSFAVLLYDDQSGMIQVPYIIEEGKKLEIPPFPMGEGLTSIVMRTGMPLLIVEDMEKNIRELGAKTVGALAKSWLGVPLKYGGETFGVIIAQDIFRENRFSEEDQRLLSTIASQVALVIRNVRLLEISKTQARLERILNQITGKIRRAMDIETILQITTDELAYALNAKKARIKIEIAKTPKKNGKHAALFVDSSSLES
jgi:transcriptional regulator with GAF, ATPase, and Fis domain